MSHILYLISFIKKHSYLQKKYYLPIYRLMRLGWIMVSTVGPPEGRPDTPLPVRSVC